MNKIIFLNEDARNLSLQNNSIDLIITSPPYFGVDTARYGDDPKKQINHEVTEEEFLNSLILATNEMYRVLKNNSAMIININTPTCFSYCHLVLNHTKFNYYDSVVWDLSSEFDKKTEFLHRKHEIWMIFYKGDKILINNFIAKKNVGMIFKSQFNNMHLPLEQELSKFGMINDAFSIEIAEHFIKLFSKKNQTIFDPFGGSGITALCAITNNRFAITNDISIDAVNLAKKRIEIYNNRKEEPKNKRYNINYD